MIAEVKLKAKKSNWYFYAGPLFCVCMLLIVFVGCSQGPKRVKMADFDPDSVADLAMQMLDIDSNSSLSEEELKQSPGLLVGLEEFDQNNDMNLDPSEIAAVLSSWRDEKAGLIPLPCEVIWKGKPLVGATVQLISEPFFEGSIPDASGTTDFAGTAELSCSAEHLPDSLKNIKAVFAGIYRIEVSHPSVDLPSKYNSNSELGRIVSLRNSKKLILKL